MKKVISTPGAPRAIGHYSQALCVDGWLYASGQIALDPQSGTLVPGGVEEQATRVFENLSAVLAAAGATFADVVKATVYLADMDSFPRMNEVYEHYFQDAYPARATVEVSRLPKDALIEVDLIARLPIGP